MSDVNKQLLNAAKLVLQQAECNLAAVNLHVLEKITAAIAAAEQAQQGAPIQQEFTVASPDVIEFLRALQVRYHDPRREDDSALGRIGLRASCLLANMSSHPAIAQPPAVADRDAIRRVFMAHGFTIKDGQTDLKPYVYEAAEALLRELSPAVAVPDGYALVPIEPTEEMVAAGAEGDSQFYDHARFVYRAMLSAATKP